MKDGMVKILKKKRWKERKIREPSLLPQMIRKKKGGIENEKS
jgi:hypothetical protein